jgi:hypothetical protein
VAVTALDNALTALRDAGYAACIPLSQEFIDGYPPEGVEAHTRLLKQADGFYTILFDTRPKDEREREPLA